MTPAVVVSNATPLIALAWLDRLALLPTLFGGVHIPPEVQREITFDPTRRQNRRGQNPPGDQSPGYRAAPHQWG